MVFKCPFTSMNINASNLEKWKKLIKMSSVISARVLSYFNVKNKEEYITLVESNINNADKLDDIYEKFLQNREEALEYEDKEAKKEYKAKMQKSVSKIPPNIIIRLLNNNDKIKAYALYKEFKIKLDEEVDDEEIIDYIDDFILKNLIYGIYNKKDIIGFIIVDTKSFAIDNLKTKVETFYIQEFLISDNFSSKGLGSILFDYIISRCPANIKYISFMTKESNEAMYKIGKKFNFILQSKKSGDSLNPSLFILER